MRRVCGKGNKSIRIISVQICDMCISFLYRFLKPKSCQTEYFSVGFAFWIKWWKSLHPFRGVVTVSQPGGAPCVIPSCIVVRGKLLVKCTVAYEECNGASLFAA